MGLHIKGVGIIQKPGSNQLGRHLPLREKNRHCKPGAEPKPSGGGVRTPWLSLSLVLIGRRLRRGGPGKQRRTVRAGA